MESMAVKNDIFQPQVHIPAMMFELITFALVLIVAIVVFRKWRERRTIATLYLSIALFFIAFAAFAVFTGLFSWLISWISAGYTTVNSPNYYNFSLPLGYCLVLPYSIFLVLFTIHIFLDKNEKKVIPFLIGGVIIGILLFLPTNYWGMDPEPTDPASRRVLISGLFLLFNTVVYILLAYFAFREAGRSEQELSRKGFLAIAFGFIANIMVFVFFLLDSILILLNPGSPGYSIFIWLGWATAIVVSFLFYLGYILPSWFRKRYEKST